jgi:MFS family permease
LFAAEIVAGSIAGLSVGALLFDVSVGLPFVVNAASFGVAAILIASIRNVRRPPTDVTAPLFDPRLRAGFVWLRNNRLLRSLAFLFTLTNLGLMFGQGIFVKYAVDELGLSNFEYGLLLAVTAMGAASGGLIGHHVIVAIGMRSSIVVPYIVFGSAQLVIGLAEQAWVVASAGFLLGAAITVWNVVTVTLRQQLIPADRFGRVNAVYRWLGAVASAVGVALGGWVAYATNLRAPFIVGGAITLVAAAVFAVPVLKGLDSET